jgi:hypothetical protein
MALRSLPSEIRKKFFSQLKDDERNNLLAKVTKYQIEKWLANERVGVFIATKGFTRTLPEKVQNCFHKDCNESTTEYGDGVTINIRECGQHSFHEWCANSHQAFC